MFLKKLMQEFWAKDVGDSLRLPNGVEVAVCDHAKGCWELTPAGERTLAGELAEIEQPVSTPRKPGRPPKGLAE